MQLLWLFKKNRQTNQKLNAEVWYIGLIVQKQELQNKEQKCE